MNTAQTILISSIATCMLIGMFTFLKKNKVGFYWINREKQKEVLEQLEQIEEFQKKSMDLRGKPTHKCICGSSIWNVKAAFEDYEIAQYFLEMECVACGSIATAPTPLDREKME